MTEKIQFLFLEMPNCRRARTPQATVLENFCYSLLNLPSFDSQPEEFRDELLNLLFKSAEIATFTPKERIQYEQDMRTEQDFKNQLAYARQEGIHQASVEMARRMLLDGEDKAKVSKYTGIAVEELNNIKL